MLPRFGDPVRKDIAYRTRPGAYAILLRGARVLVTHQSMPHPEYQLPGGGIDPGESPLPALVREAREETGWNVRILRRLGAYQRFTYMPEYDLWARKVCHIYLGAPILPRRGQPLEPGHSAHWMLAEEALASLASAGDRHYLARAMSLVGETARRHTLPKQ